jgi:hypothetical protein
MGNMPASLGSWSVKFESFELGWINVWRKFESFEFGWIKVWPVSFSVRRSRDWECGSCGERVSITCSGTPEARRSRLCRRLRKQRKMRARAKKATKTRAPNVIPTIAPVESLDLPELEPELDTLSAVAVGSGTVTVVPIEGVAETVTAKEVVTD